MVRQYGDNLLLTCSNDGAVKVWDSRSFEQVGTCKSKFIITKEHMRFIVLVCIKIQFILEVLEE
jgi:WD40 repeat protein